MPSKFIVQGLPDDAILRNSDDMGALRIEANCLHKSKAVTFTGDVTNQVHITPASGNRIVVKGFTILGDGAVGTVKILKGDNLECMLPCYFSAQARSSGSGAVNILLAKDEKVLITTTGRSTNETFVGVSYLEVKG